PTLERGDRALPLLLPAERRHYGQPPAPLLRAGPRRLGGRHRTGGARAPPGRARRLLFVGLERGAGQAEHRLGLCFVLAEPLLGFLLGLALGLFVVAAPVLFLALAPFRCLALQPLAALALGAPVRLLLGDAALLGLAQARVAERMGAPVEFLVGQGAQHHAGRLRRCTSRGGRCGRAGRLLGAPPARARGPLGRRARRLGDLCVARAVHAALHFLNDHRLAAAVAEALAHDSLLAALERERLGRSDRQRLF